MKALEMHRSNSGRLTRPGWGKIAIRLGPALLFALAMAAPWAPANATTGPVHTAELSLPNKIGEGFYLGTNAALSGNGSVALLSSWGRKIGTAMDPAAEVFTLKSGKWTGPVDLSLGKGLNSRTNLPVALNSSGTVALVGYFNATVHGVQRAGEVFVFSFSHGVWSRTAVLSLGSSAGLDELGKSVALSGSGTTALLGAPSRKVSGKVVGAGEVFTLSNGSWHKTAELNLGARSSVGAYLGWTAALSASGQVALLGTYNGSGAEVFNLKGSHWSSATQLSGGGGLQAGQSVALNATGTTALIGGVSARTAGLFTYRSGTWSVPSTLRFHLGGGGGYADFVTTSISLNAAGTSALIGSPGWYQNNGNTADAGVLDDWLLKNGVWTQGAPQSLAKPKSHDDFGTTTALSATGATGLACAPQRTVAGRANAGACEAYSLPIS